MGAGRKIDFVVAGVQKGGTSALFRYLQDHPDLQLPANKEAHFFDDETVDWRSPDPRPYHDLFVEDGRMRGDATPIYCYWPPSFERLAAYNPAARVILLLRDPVERAWSHWKMEYAKGKERHPFAWCIRDGRARVAAGDATCPGHHRVFSYVERGFYGTQAARLLTHFPARQCLLLRSQDLRDRPDATIGRICTFLGVAPLTTAVVPRVERAAVAMPYPSTLTREDVALLAGLYEGEMALLSALSDVDCADWVEHWAALADPSHAAG